MISEVDRSNRVVEEWIWSSINFDGTCARTISSTPSLVRTPSSAALGGTTGVTAAGWLCAGAAGDVRRLIDHQPAAPASAAAPSTAATRSRRDFRRTAGGAGGGATSVPESESRFSNARAARTSCMDCQRSSRFLRRHRSAMVSSAEGTPAVCVRGRTSSRRIAESVEIAESPPNARSPVTISCSMAPKAKMSDLASTGLPSACSGDM